MSRFHSSEDIRRVARRRMPRMMFDFVDGGAGREQLLGRNREAFDRWLLHPRVLRKVQTRDLSTSLFGRDWKLPFGIAPMGMCDLAWPGTDRALANAAVSAGIPLATSTAASTSLEEMARLAGDHCWFQLYVSQTDELTFNMLERAQNAGMEVLVFTVDVPEVSPRLRDQRNGFQANLRIGPRQFLDFALHPAWSISTLLAGTPSPANYSSDSGVDSFNRGASRARVDKAYLEHVRERWKGKLVVKGVLHPGDASELRQLGVDGVWVSNHGGRQLDSAPAAIDCLAAVRNAVGDSMTVIFDSGVRDGESLLKALALGADFVMLGRPFLFAAGAGGEAVINRQIELLAEGLSLGMAQTGCLSIADISSDMVMPDPGRSGSHVAQDDHQSE